MPQNVEKLAEVVQTFLRRDITVRIVERIGDEALDVVCDYTVEIMLDLPQEQSSKAPLSRLSSFPTPQVVEGNDEQWWMR